MRVNASLLYLHATAIMLARAVLFPILSSLPPDHHRLTWLLKGDKLRCANVNFVLHYNTIVQRRSGYVVSLATPTKAEPLYKVHTHAGSASYL